MNDKELPMSDEEFAKRLWLSDRIKLLAGVLPKSLTPQIISEYVDQLVRFPQDVLRKAFDDITGEEIDYFPSPGKIIQYCTKINRDMVVPQIEERDQTPDEKRRAQGAARYAKRIIFIGGNMASPEHQAHILHIFNSPDWRLEDEIKIDLKMERQKKERAVDATALDKVPNCEPWTPEPLPRREDNQ